MKKTLPFRMWFYFRTGYAQYFLFIFSLLNMFTLTYYLAVSKNENLEFLFPSFLSYVVLLSIVITPTLCLIGYVHLKRSKAHASEIDVATEADPYHYKLAPGIMKECMAPMYLELLRLGVKALQNSKNTDKDVRNLEELYVKLKTISEGSSLPRPKKFDEI